ncbi:MAG: ATP-binding protein, partial [Psychrosphaera sp.]|nr:ATP-binding protein [Psychrosphaera sp.]
ATDSSGLIQPTVLRAGQSRLVQFEFSTLALTDASHSIYQYQLIGHDHNPIELKAPKHSAAYINLPQGDYVFKVAAIVAGNQHHSTELAFTVASQLWFSWWAYTLYTVMGIVLVWLLMMARTRALVQTSLQLERQVNIRTSELLHARQRVEMLAQQSKQLIENIYHQTRTPLQLMLANIEAIEQQQLSIGDYSVKQKQQIDRVLHLTDQVLDISRVNVSGQSPQTVEDLATLLKPLLAGLSDVAKAKGIALDWQVSSHLPVKCSLISIEKAIDNIVGNAIKYTDRGLIRFTALQDQQHVVICCMDTGIGITQNDKSNIFKRYYRGSNAGHMDGAGIGLAMVKDVIDAHGGHVDINSEVNKGTSVTIELPLAVAPFETPDLSKISLLAADELSCQQQSQNKRKVLIVEDNLELADYLRKLLQPRYQVLLALEAQSALVRVKNEAPDLIVSDIMLGSMNGYELTRQLKKMPQTGHIPVILLTAKSDRLSREQGYA